MSTYSLEINRVLVAQFKSLLSAYTVRWPNRNFTTPNGSPWLSYSVLTGSTFEQTLSDTDRVNGIVQIDCYIPEFQGENFAYQVADVLNNGLPKNGIALTNTYGTTKVQIKTVRQPRQSEDPNWHKMIIEVTFYAFVGR